MNSLGQPENEVPIIPNQVKNQTIQNEKRRMNDEKSKKNRGNSI